MNDEYSDLTNSDDDEKKSHFQFEERHWFQGVHQTTGVIPNKISVFIQNFEMGLRFFPSNKFTTKILSWISIKSYY